jgi:uncharacterized membrane protein
LEPFDNDVSGPKDAAFGSVLASAKVTCPSVVFGTRVGGLASLIGSGDIDRAGGSPMYVTGRKMKPLSAGVILYVEM